MAEGQLEDFINKLPAERKPLSEQEEKEAMIEAWKLRDLAKARIRKGKYMAILEGKDGDKGFIIYINLLKAEDPKLSGVPQDSDVSIDVLWKAKDSKGRNIDQSFDFYYLSSSSVAKVITTPPQDRDALEETDFIEDSLRREAAVRKRTLLSREQATQEIYFPDKSDLRTLSKLIASAQEAFPSVSSVKK